MRPLQNDESSHKLRKHGMAINQKFESVSNEKIKANDLEVLAENLYQEFFIQPIQLRERILYIRNITLGRIAKFVDSLFRDVHGSEYVNVDGIIATLYFHIREKIHHFNIEPHLFTMFQRRYVFVHNGGLVDSKYIEKKG